MKGGIGKSGNNSGPRYIALTSFRTSGKLKLNFIFNPDSKGVDDLVSSFAPTESISLSEAIKRFPS
jgi:hypothetical protein